MLGFLTDPPTFLSRRSMDPYSISALLSQGYLPTALIETTSTMVPIVKIKLVIYLTAISNNYRLIVLATAVSKILYFFVLIKCGKYLTFLDNQFGFKCFTALTCVSLVFYTTIP